MSPLGVSGAGSRQAPRRIIGSERLRRRGAAGTAVRSLLYAHWAAGGTAPPSSGNISRSEEHTSELQSIMRISYAVFCLKKKTNEITTKLTIQHSAYIHIQQPGHTK